MTDYLWLRAQAPFAAYRYFQAGSYRATMPIIPPSAALGLILNIAAIEMRESVDSCVTLQIRKDIPHLCLAIGTVNFTQTVTCKLYQQLQSYPVGKSGTELKAYVHGQKYWIVPVKREILVDLDLVIGIRNPEDWLVDRIQRGLTGEFNTERYGLPFAGDNNLLFDRIDLIESPPEETQWYVQMQSNDSPREGSCRLTVGIDRADNSKTTKFLYAPVSASNYPPEEAWTWTPKQPDAVKI